MKSSSGMLRRPPIACWRSNKCGRSSMATVNLPPDFKEFLKLLNSTGIEYLLIGGYAVGYHGYPRATADLDIWIAVSSENARNMMAVLKEFGFDLPQLQVEIFEKQDQLIRLGRPPIRIEILTTISGVEFGECYAGRVEDQIDGVPAKIISLEHLKKNKRASGRHQDLADLEHLP